MIMKNYIFLCSVCFSFISFGQVQEQKSENQESQKDAPNAQIEVKNTSKVSKINKRIDVTRPEKAKVSPVSTTTKEP